ALRVELGLALVARQLAKGRLERRRCAQVYAREGRRQLGVDELEGQLDPGAVGEGRAEDLVPVDDRAESGPERLGLERARQAHGRLKAAAGAVRLGDPQPFLLGRRPECRLLGAHALTRSGAGAANLRIVEPSASRISNRASAAPTENAGPSSDARVVKRP